MVYSLKPRSDVYCFRLNFNTSNLPGLFISRLGKKNWLVDELENNEMLYKQYPLIKSKIGMDICLRKLPLKSSPAYKPSRLQAHLTVNYPASRGLFPVAFAELTGARKRDLCPGSKQTILSMRNGYLATEPSSEAMLLCGLIK